MQAEDFLREKDLRPTDCRVKVLDFLIETPFSLTYTEIEKKFQEFDRVTIYRTLQTFLDKEIIHKIPDDTGTTLYALNKYQENAQKKSIDKHIHFKCLSCLQIVCLREQAVPAVILPDGYSAFNVNVLGEGNCIHCQFKN